MRSGNRGLRPISLAIDWQVHELNTSSHSRASTARERRSRPRLVLCRGGRRSSIEPDDALISGTIPTIAAAKAKLAGTYQPGGTTSSTMGL